MVVIHIISLVCWGEVGVEGDAVVGVLLCNQPLEEGREELQHHFFIEDSKRSDLVTPHQILEAALDELVDVVAQQIHLSFGHQSRLRERLHSKLDEQHQQSEHLLELAPFHSFAELLQELGKHPSHSQTALLSARDQMHAHVQNSPYFIQPSSIHLFFGQLFEDFDDGCQMECILWQFGVYC